MADTQEDEQNKSTLPAMQDASERIHPASQSVAPANPPLQQLLEKILSVRHNHSEDKPNASPTFDALKKNGFLPPNSSWQNYHELMGYNKFLNSINAVMRNGGLKAFVEQVARVDESFVNGKISILAYGTDAIVLQNEQGNVLRMSSGAFEARPDIPQCLPTVAYGEITLGNEKLHVEVVEKVTTLHDLVKHRKISFNDAVKLQESLKTSLAHEGYVFWDDTRDGHIRLDNVGVNAKGEAVLVDPQAIEHIDARSRPNLPGHGFRSRVIPEMVADYEKRIGLSKPPVAAIDFSHGVHGGKLLLPKATLSRDAALALEKVLNDNGCTATRASSDRINYNISVDKVNPTRDESIAIQRAFKEAGIDVQRVKDPKGHYGFRVTGNDAIPAVTNDIMSGDKYKTFGAGMGMDESKALRVTEILQSNGLSDSISIRKIGEERVIEIGESHKLTQESAAALQKALAAEGIMVEPIKNDAGHYGLKPITAPAAQSAPATPAKATTANESAPAPRNPTSLADVRTALSTFSPDDFTRRFYPLSTTEEVAIFQKAVAGGQSNTVKNPYDNKCGAYTAAFHDHLSALGIPNMHVSSNFHQFLLIPVDTAAGREFHIFDPTIQQFYPNQKDSFFLGTTTELESFERDNYRPTRNGRSLESLYFNDVHIIDNGGLVFENGKLPISTERFFLGEPLRLLNGTETQDQQRAARLDKHLAQFSEESRPSEHARQLQILADMEASSREAREKITTRLQASGLKAPSTPEAIALAKNFEKTSGAVGVGMAAYSFGRAANILYDELSRADSFKNHDELTKSKANLINATAQLITGAATLKVASKKIPIIGALIDGGTEVFNGSVDEKSAMEKGDGYTAYLAANKSYIKGGAKVAMGTTMAIGGAAAGTVVGPEGTIALGIGGFLVGLSIDPAAEAIAKPVAELISQNSEEPARLQGIADAKNLEKAKTMLADAVNLISADKTAQLHQNAAYHLEHKTVATIGSYDTAFHAVDRLVAMNKKNGKPIDVAVVKGTLENAQKTYIQAVSQSPANPLTRAEGEQAVEQFKKLEALKVFLEGRPINENDSAAREQRAKIMTTINEAEKQLQPALASHQLYTRIEKDISLNNLQTALDKPSPFEDLFPAASNNLPTGQPYTVLGGDEHGHGAINRIVANAENWNKIVSGDQKAALAFMEESKLKVGDKVIGLKPGTDIELYRKAQDALGIRRLQDVLNGNKQEQPKELKLSPEAEQLLFGAPPTQQEAKKPENAASPSPDAAAKPVATAKMPTDPNMLNALAQYQSGYNPKNTAATQGPGNIPIAPGRDTSQQMA